MTRPALPLPSIELAPRELAARDPSPTLALDYGMSLETYNKLVTRRELETEDTVAGDDALAGTLAAAPTTLRASASDAPLARGEVIGRYVVLDLVGAGGMGVVYAGYDPELDRKVALKLLRAPPPSAAASPSASGSRRRLVREAQALAKLAHPNVVAIHDVGEHDGSVWLAMEFVAGVTLAAWLRARPRSWPEVLEVLIPAGRGLAAAHEAQLLHRDFKPENIMVGDDGRVRVMDLGLARVTGDEPRAPPPAQDVALDGVAEALLPTLLTHGGALIGTPAYMAPEQLQGREVDVRADVFAFCVTLWEALHGVRPFAGETLAALTARVLAGEVSPPPSGRAAPAWLRRVCLRGLALEPGRRWSSMAAALAALDRGRRRARATRWIASIAALALAGAGLALHERAQAQALVAACEAAGSVDDLWNDDARAKLRAGLLATEAPYAPRTVDQVLPRLDAQARELHDAAVEACLDARVRGRWDADTLDRATLCLDERRMELEALIAELTRARPTSAQHAVQAAAGLAQLEPCRDARRLALLPAPPGERAPVEAVRRVLSRAGALEAAGEYNEGLAVAQEGLAAAEELAWPPLIAAARGRVGSLLFQTGSYPAAEATLEDAYFQAAELGALEVAADAALLLITTVGEKLARPGDGLRWARHAEVARVALDADALSLRRAAALTNVASVHRSAGAYDEARPLYEQALALREQALGAEHPDVAASLHNLAIIDWSTGAYEQALPLYQRALELREAALGPKHPLVASTLNNLAAVHASAGRSELALPLYQRALAIREAALGPEHPTVSGSLSNIALIHSANGDYAQASALLERALTIREAAFGPDHPVIAETLINLASVRGPMGEHAAAKELLTRALTIWEAALGDRHPNVATTLYNLAEAHLSMGERAAARPLLERALALWEETLGATHPHIASPLTALADLALTDGHPDQALPLAQRAVTVSAGGPDEPRARALFALARALWDAPPRRGRDRDQALQRAAEARELYASLPGPRQGRDDVEAFLAEKALGDDARE